jgi:hypothetical protein
MTRFILGGVMALALLAGSSLTATASEYCYRGGCKYEKVVKYVPVITYETRTEAYTKYVTCYDHCGRPYQVARTCYRTYEAPVKSVKTVVCWVKVCY